MNTELNADSVIAESSSEVTIVVAEKIPNKIQIVNRKLFGDGFYEEFYKQICDHEQLIVVYEADGTRQTRVIDSSQFFEHFIYHVLDGENIFGFYAVPAGSTQKFYDKSKSREYDIKSDIKRPVEDLVFSAIRHNIPVSDLVD